MPKNRKEPLSNDAVRFIRNNRDKHTLAEMGEMFGRHGSSIYQIQQHGTYKHVPRTEIELERIKVLRAKWQEEFDKRRVAEQAAANRWPWSNPKPKEETDADASRPVRQNTDRA